MRILQTLLCIGITTATLQGLGQKTLHPNKAVNPAAKPRFKTLALLDSISGKATISGVHNREPNAEPAKWTEEIYKTTGKYPGLWSGDFLFQAENIANRKTMINEALNRWKQGFIINIMWHSCNPALDEPCGWDSAGVLSKLSDPQWKELTTDGTSLNRRWKVRVDEIASHLQFLKANGVEVMFRPFHEMNQRVFWWGGRPGPEGTVKLYKLLHDYLVNTKGLTNLIWVWDIQDFGSLASDAVNYNPGNDYWDIAALDVYDKTGYTISKYNTMLGVSNGKPIAIGECQQLPTAGELAAQPKWTFFMSWAELTFKHNSSELIKALYQAGNVLTLEEIR